jgi:anthranilate synthase component 2
MILVLDNYDSFVHNLARYLQRLGQVTEVVRSDMIDVRGVRNLHPQAIVISPGPCTPREAGCSVSVVREMWRDIPILGVCLGHQAIAEAFGAEIVRAPQPWHGRTSEVYHLERGLFSGVPNPVTVCRYHSLVAEERTLSDVLQVTGRTADGVVMAFEHVAAPVVGVQFHPEAILTKFGFRMLANFLTLAGFKLTDNLPTEADELLPSPIPSWPYPDRPLTF